MNILITGSEGVIGKELVQQLKGKHELHLWDKLNGFDLSTADLRAGMVLGTLFAGAVGLTGDASAHAVEGAFQGDTLGQEASPGAEKPSVADTDPCQLLGQSGEPNCVTVKARRVKFCK